MYNSAYIRLLLLQHRSAPIQGFGWLEVEHSEAYLTAARTIEPPRRTLCAVPDGALCGVMGYSYVPIYIEGVGTIYPETLQVELDPWFDSLLNPVEQSRGNLARIPAPTAPAPRSVEIDPNAHQIATHKRGIGVRPNSRNPHNYTTSALAVIVALGAIGYIVYYLLTKTEVLPGILAP